MRVSARLLVLMALVAATGCTRTSGVSAGDTLRVALFQDERTLNPILGADTVDVFVHRLLFEPLISADPHGNPVPMLASTVPTVANGGISKDGLTVTYRLRSNAKWSDGVPVTSADVRFSWQALMNPANNVVSRHGYDDVTRIDTPDRLTAVVHLKRPFAPFVSTFFGESDQPYLIIPQHALAKYPNLNNVPFNTEPTVTDGPFRFVQWVHGDRIVLERNDDFFMGKPKLARIVLRPISDENTSINLLRTHEIDYVVEASISTYPQLHSIPGVRVVGAQQNGYEGLGFNLSRKPLDDLRVRQAISYAIDRPQLVRTLTYGQSKIATADLPDWMWAANRSLTPYPQDITKAKSLMRAAGVHLPLNLVLVTEAANTTYKRLAVEAQSQLHEIGVNLEVKTFPTDLLYAPQGMGGIITGGKFDLSVWPWVGGTDPDNSSEFSCAAIPPGGWNTGRYCSAEMDRLQREALVTYDRDARAKTYREIESLVYRDLPILPIWWRTSQQAISTAFLGFAPNPSCESWNAWEWSLGPRS